MQNRWLFDGVFCLKRRTKRKITGTNPLLLRTLILSLVAVLKYKTRKQKVTLKSRRTPPIFVEFAPINSSRKKPKPPDGEGGSMAG